MQPREKILAGSLAAIVAVWFLRPAFNAMFIEPLGSRNAAIQTLDNDVADLKVREAELFRDTEQLAEWRDASLPPDTYDAEREYPKWLRAMAHLSGWEEIDIVPGARNNRQSSFAGVSATIHAEATVKSVTPERHRAEIDFVVTNADGTEVFTGETTIYQAEPIS